jgi:hypothetical protein
VDVGENWGGCVGGLVLLVSGITWSRSPSQRPEFGYGLLRIGMQMRGEVLQCSGNKSSILGMFLSCEKLPKVMSSACDDLLVHVYTRSKIWGSSLC